MATDLATPDLAVTASRERAWHAEMLTSFIVS